MPDKMTLGDWHEPTPLVERAAKTLTQRSDLDAVDERPRRRAASAKTPDEPAATQSAEAVFPGSAVRRSRYAEVNFDQLARRGFLTPNAVRSRTKEEFRVIKRSILQHAFQPAATHGMPGNLVMVTSARPGEGKTFTAVNLAISIALERDYTVLLIDADFGRPKILDVLGLTADKGMVELLADPSMDLADVLIRTNIDRLSVLPAGRSHSLSTELLTSQRMKDMVAEIARRYHDRIIIFDAPPVLSTSEACALAMHVGQIVLVLEAGKTPKVAIRETLRMLDTGARIGVVLNRCDAKFGQVRFGSYYER